MAIGPRVVPVFSSDSVTAQRFSARGAMADKLPFFASEWEACDPEGFAARAERPETVLETISRVRLADVQAAAAVLPLEELKAKVEAEAGPAIDFYERLTRVDGMAVLAEIKRASPSKAWIDPDCVAPEQGERYAKAGAAAISVRRDRPFRRSSA